MTEKTPELLHYHSFHKYGHSGIRYRDSCDIVKEILDFAGNISDVSYSTIVEFVKLKWLDQMPVYLQLEHV